MLKSVSLLSYLWLFSLNLAGFWFCSGFGSSLNFDILPNNQTSTFAAVRHLHKKCVERSLNLIKSSLVSWQGIRKKASKKILSSTTSFWRWRKKQQIGTKSKSMCCQKIKSHLETMRWKMGSLSMPIAYNTSLEMTTLWSLKIQSSTVDVFTEKEMRMF